MSNTQNSLQLELHVPNFQKVKDFYGLLGFSVLWERKPEEFKGYLVVQNETGCILNFWGGNEHIFEQPYFGRFADDAKRGYGVEIVVTTTQDLKKLQQRLQVAQYEVVEELIRQPWGLDDFRVEDPFGYYVRVTTPHDITDPGNAVA
jgi:lactoylglutathione lyase